jgi:hypothetical protein
LPRICRRPTLPRMRRIIALVIVGSAVLLGGPPALSLAKAPPSFALWWGRFSAGVQRDITRIGDGCEKRYGRDDAKVGACFVKAERVSLRGQRAALKKQIAMISRGQTAPCRKAIRVYWLASRKAANLNLAYLDSHPHVAVTRMSRDLNRKPYTTLKSLSFEAKTRAIRVCG